MNYHIITQDKFFDAYIEDIYKLHQEENNVFWVRGRKGDTPWLKTNRTVEYVPEENVHFVQKLKTLKPEDKLFVSWFDTWIGECVIYSGISNPVYAWIMGGEYYAEPFWYHANWLFDKLTLKYILKQQKYGYPTINWFRRPKNWRKVYDEYCLHRAFMPMQRQQYAQKLRTMQRIDYLICPEYDSGEYDLIRELYPNCHFRRISGVYNQNFDIAIRMGAKRINMGDTLKVLIGNSADPSNNYLDAFSFFKRRINHRCEVYSSLSYGDEQNRDFVINRGKEMFGDAFHSVTGFMGRNEYLQFLCSMDVLIMYHNRQQACGNIMSAITLGKPVFLKKRNPIYSMLMNAGVSSVYDVSQLGTINLEQVVQSAYDERNKNSDIISRMCSEETRLNYWRELLELQ